MISVTFVTEAELDALFYAGTLVPSNALGDVPNGTVQDQEELLDQLQKLLHQEYDSHLSLVSFEIWGDSAVQLSIDVTILGRELLALLTDFVRNNAPAYTMYCSVEELNGGSDRYFGRVVFNHEVLLVEYGVKDVWLRQIGDSYQWKTWDAILND